MDEFKTPTTKRVRSRMTDNPELQTPIKIPSSQFLKQIGYGCGVNVFSLERSPRVGFARSPWAIKKRNCKTKEGKVYDQRIRFEAEILRKLQHPNIVGFRAFTQAPEGEPCLAMEQLDASLGDTIEEKLEKDAKPFPADDILKISYEIVKGLEYLHHTALILHGDIKSYNVLISKDYKIVKLCDFGVSVPLNKSLELDTTRGDFNYIGTECWTAREVLEDGVVTNKADIWAYGLVIWEMIALSPPYTTIEEDPEDESSFDDSMYSEKSANELTQDRLNDDLNESISCLKDMFNDKFGTRPPLPAIELGNEYQKVLEIFFACTTVDCSIRPSAKGLVNFFTKYVYKTTQ